MVTLAPPAKPEQSLGRRIEILGVFGSGKTTLARNLVTNSEHLLAEQHEQNPFWGAEKSNQTLGYLPYDLSFLMQHAQLVTSVSAEEILFCDWSFESDRTWASMRLEHDFSAYDAVHQIIQQRLPSPIGYLYLKQPADVIVKRLELRGREPEKSLVEYVVAAMEQLEILVCSLPSSHVLEVTDDTSLDEVCVWLQNRGEN
jgi:deoxyadenosine/deoxycytidine kinase